jgi:putative IMPACT (imprinted ancient) family translation regulator
VLRGSGLGDVVVVVTRYYGGTKLGTGGLVRAYSEAVRLVVEAVPRAQKVLAHSIMLVFPYTYLERVRLLIVAQDGKILDEDFNADVTMTARLRVEKLDAFQVSLSELTNGKVWAEVIETQQILMPLSS